MAAAEEIYETFESDQVPPVTIDIAFALIMIIVHTVYLFKFTTFSLSYLEARIIEKKHTKEHGDWAAPWAESLRYCRTVWEWRRRVFDGADYDWGRESIREAVDGTVWKQLVILRWSLSIGMAISGLMVFISFIIFQINFIYEYLVLSYFEGGFPIFLAIFTLPFYTYCSVVIAKYFLSAIRMMWCIKIDRIGDAIVRDDYEEDEDDRVARDIDRERTKRESSIPKIHFRYRSKTTEGPPDPPIDNHQSVMTESVDLNQYESEVSSSQRESVSVPQTVKNELNGFYCPYFMAVRWRLLNFLLSVIATLLAMPYVTNQRFGFRLFVRYCLISSETWIGVYGMFSLIMGLIARCKTRKGIDVTGFQINLKADGREQSTDTLFVEERIDKFLGICCCKDEYGSLHTVDSYTWCKVGLGILIWFMVFAMAIARPFVDNGGFLGFAVVCLVLYYFATLIIAHVKPHGIYVLCNGDMRALRIWKWRLPEGGIDDQCQALIGEIKKEKLLDLEIDEKELTILSKTSRSEKLLKLTYDYPPTFSFTVSPCDQGHGVILPHSDPPPKYEVYKKETGIYPILFDSVYRSVYRYRRSLYAKRDMLGWLHVFKFPEIHWAYEGWRYCNPDAEIIGIPEDVLLNFIQKLDEVSLEWQELNFDDPNEQEQNKSKMEELREHYEMRRASMLYALRRYAMEYEKEREQRRKRMDNTVAEIVQDPQAFEDYITEQRNGSQTEKNNDLDEQRKELQDYAYDMDRDDFGLTRIHELYKQYYLRFGEECTGLLEPKNDSEPESFSSGGVSPDVDRSREISDEVIEALSGPQTKIPEVTGGMKQTKVASRGNEEKEENVEYQWNKHKKRRFEQIFQENVCEYFSDRNYDSCCGPCGWYLKGLFSRDEDEAFHRRLMRNYFESLLRLYRAYWRVLLPYRNEIRPLAICFSDTSYIEKLVDGGCSFCCCKEYDIKNDEYNKIECSQCCTECIRLSWRSTKALKGYFLGSLIAMLFIIAAWASYAFYAVTHDDDITFLWDDLIDSEGSEETVYGSSSYNAVDSWPICEDEWNGNLSTFDLTVMTEMVYALGSDDVQLSPQEMSCLYFDTMDIAELRYNDSTTLSEDDCSWQIVHNATDYPYFMHLRNDKYATDLIAIRGTASLWDMAQDFVLYNQVAMIQAASWTIPMTTILPRTSIADFVYTGALFEGIISTNLRERYDGPIFEYVRSLLESTTNPIESLYFAGHSLGGGVAKIVGAQIYRAMEEGYIDNNVNQSLIADVEIKSFALASPGLSFSARKFSVHIEDIYNTAIEIRPELDIVSAVDVHVGRVSFVECGGDNMIDCHKSRTTICEMMEKCNAYKLHNPDLVGTWCDLEDSSIPLGNVWNMTEYTG